MFDINIFVIISFIFVIFCYLFREHPQIQKIADIFT